jgi:2-polyprenyl-6-methoxyphenol hydroxylase-like FAD-dependent oxidoreductase
MEAKFDVVVVGSGPAGCTAAILLGRAGLSVALLEAHRDPEHYKRLCTHSIRSGTLPTLKRLGLDTLMDGLGAVRHHENLWTRSGWIHERRTAPHGYNIRRATLDPVLRATAASVPGVELMMGAKMRELMGDAGGRVSGVVAEVGGERRQLGSRLVVGADGYRSKVAELAGLPGRLSANKRFGYQAGYRNVRLPPGWTGAIWVQEPRANANAVFCNNDGVAMLAAFHLKDRLADFKRDREDALLSSFASLADAPDLSRAERVTDFIGTADYPSMTRRHMVRPGVALVGDAAMVGDPLQGVGCGWAFQSAEWLADAVAGPLTSGGGQEIDTGARRYERRHRRTLLPHQLTNNQISRAENLTPMMRTLYGGASRNQRVADRVIAVATRNSSPLTLFDPILLTRAAITRRRPLTPV